MRRAKFTLLAAGLLAVVAGGVLTVQRRVASQLRDEVELLRAAQSREIARLQAENRRLSAMLVPAGALENLRVEHAAIVRLRDEIEGAGRQGQSGGDPSSPGRAGTTESGASMAEPPADGAMVPASAWRNAGRATPAATIETALWAVAGGDIGTLAQMLSLSADGRAKGAAVLAGLPETIQQEFGTPERLIAVLVAKDLPLSATSAMQVTGPLEGAVTAANPGATYMQLRLQNADGSIRNTTLSLKQDADGWGFDVPTDVVDKYLRTVANTAGK